jgi:hypothetical protein
MVPDQAVIAIITSATVRLGDFAATLHCINIILMSIMEAFHGAMSWPENWKCDTFFPHLDSDKNREPISMEKRHISAHEVLEDIHAGLDHIALMAKYKLSEKDFRGLCAKLIEAGRLTEVELAELELLWAQKEGRVWRCPACRMPQAHEFDECPQCGIIVAKYELRRPREEVEPDELEPPEPANDPMQETGQQDEFEFIQPPPTDSKEDVPKSTNLPAPDSPAPGACPACGESLSRDARFCTSCGVRVRD